MSASRRKEGVSPIFVQSIMDFGGSHTEDDSGAKRSHGKHRHHHPIHVIDHKDIYQNGDGTEEDLILYEESSLIKFVDPVFTILRWIGFTHYRFEFNRNDQAFYAYSGSLFRKILCVTIQVLVTILGYAEQQIIQRRNRNSPIYGLYKAMSISYTVFTFTFFHAMMTKGGDFQEIFNFVQETTKRIRKTGCLVPQQRHARMFSLGLVALTLVHAICYTAEGIEGQTDTGLWRGNGLSNMIPAVTDNFVRIYLVTFVSPNINLTELDEYKFSESHSTPVVSLLSICHFFLFFLGTLTWSLAFLMNTCFGLLFWKVLRSFFIVVRKNCSRNTLEDLRAFNCITGIIDLYNAAYGWVILTSVITGVCHFSVHIVQMFKATVEIQTQIAIGFSFLLFGLQLLASAQVNQEASDIVDVIKLRYQMEPVWKELHGNCLETTQGLLLTFQEVSTNKIGFQGLGFFTITYAFLGTVLSVISTYAIVVLQLQT